MSRSTGSPSPGRRIPSVRGHAAGGIGAQEGDDIAGDGDLPRLPEHPAPRRTPGRTPAARCPRGRRPDSGPQSARRPDQVGPRTSEQFSYGLPAGLGVQAVLVSAGAGFEARLWTPRSVRPPTSRGGPAAVPYGPARRGAHPLGEPGDLVVYERVVTVLVGDTIKVVVAAAHWYHPTRGCWRCWRRRHHGPFGGRRERAVEGRAVRPGGPTTTPRSVSSMSADQGEVERPAIGDTPQVRRISERPDEHVHRAVGVAGDEDSWRSSRTPRAWRRADVVGVSATLVSFFAVRPAAHVALGGWCHRRPAGRRRRSCSRFARPGRS